MCVSIHAFKPAQQYLSHPYLELRSFIYQGYFNEFPVPRCVGRLVPFFGSRELFEWGSVAMTPPPS